MDRDKWFAIQVNCRQESLIARQFRMKGYEEFLPLYSQATCPTHKTKLHQPIFPGYVFCRLNLSERILPILTTPGVIRIVGTGRVPVAIEDSELETIRTAVAFGRIEPFPGFAEGRRVVLTEGPLAGCEGVILQIKKGWRLVISVALLQRSVAVEIDRCWARPVSTAPLRRPSESGLSAVPQLKVC